MPVIPEKYSILFDQPVFKEGGACQFGLRAEVNTSELDGEGAAFVKRLSELGLWQSYEFDSFSITTVRAESADGYIRAVQNACESTVKLTSVLECRVV
jgi:hypothetical protein